MQERCPSCGAGLAPRDEGDYGPRGYLPERAARRARKIVLRSPLGIQWVVAALAAGLVLLVAAVAFVRVAAQAPGAPFVDVGETAAVEGSVQRDDLGVVLVRVGVRVRAFAAPAGDVPAWCPLSGRLESPSGRVWSLTGRGLDGGASLDEHPTVDHRGRLYVDPTTRLPGPPPDDTGARPACVAAAGGYTRTRGA